MTTLKDLVDASKNTYTYQAFAEEKGVKGFKLFSTSFDEKSNHSGLAYVNHDNGEVILAHRGTDFTKLKDIVTDAQIALNWKETKADMAAVRFTEQVIDNLIDQNFDIKKVISTGHSLGGREAQHCLKILKDTSDYQAEAVTFNSARVSLNGTDGKEYDHLNLRLKGNKIFSTDLVTSFGSHLGETVDIVLPEVKNFIQAHKLTSFDLMSKHYSSAYESMPVSDLIAISKSNSDMSIFNSPTVDLGANVQQLEYSNFGVDLPVVLQAEIGKSYNGEVVAETDTSYIQRLGDTSKFFANHSKNAVDNDLKIGDKVQIKYSLDPSKKAVTKELNEGLAKSKSR